MDALLIYQKPDNLDKEYGDECVIVKVTNDNEAYLLIILVV